MARSRTLRLQWPLAGFDERTGYQERSPFTTPGAINVRPTDGINVVGRRRGASRPGATAQFGGTQVGAGRMRLLTTIEGFNPGTYHEFLDSFDRQTWGTAWSVPSGIAKFPDLVDDYAQSTEAAATATKSGATVNVVDFDPARPYSVGIRIWLAHRQASSPVIVPDGAYWLLLRMVDDKPLAFGSGAAVIALKLIISTVSGALTYEVEAWYDDAGAYTYAATVTPPQESAEFIDFVAVSKGTSWACYLGGEQVFAWHDAGGDTRHRAGFAMIPTASGSQCKVDRFWMDYYKTNPVTAGQTRIVASAAGALKYENNSGQLVAPTTSITLSSDKPLQAASMLGKLFIADYGDVRLESETGFVQQEAAASGQWLYCKLDDGAVADWTAHGINKYIHVAELSNPQGGANAGVFEIQQAFAGNLRLKGYPRLQGDDSITRLAFVKYKISRGPLVFDPVENTLALWWAEPGKGFVPVGCPLICRYQGRLVLAGPNHVWYMSRRGDPFDFNYGASAADPNRAVAGTLSQSGIIGDRLVSTMPAGDDYLLFGTASQVHLMRGDPTLGGRIDVVSTQLGVLGGQAWCSDPSGAVYWIGSDKALWAMRPGVDAVPVSLSAERLGRNFNVLVTADANMAYDARLRALHIFLPGETGPGQHWLYDLENKAFWPVSFGTTNCEPCVSRLVATTVGAPLNGIENDVLMGGRDGKVYKFSNPTMVDGGATFETYVDIGPLQVAPDGADGRLEALIATLAEFLPGSVSGAVAWSVRSGDTPEGAVLNLTPDITGTWLAGRNPDSRVRVRGPWVVIRLANGQYQQWALDGLLARIGVMGRHRLL